MYNSGSGEDKILYYDTNRPLVSVVMPVYNQERYISDAVECILGQTFADFELIIVDDGSTDRTVEIVKGFDDPRIRLVEEQHSGFITTLVKGYQEAKGTWIARMDSDDLCLPERLARQLDFLANHPECAFVGTAYGFVTPNGHCVKPQSPFDWRYLEPSQITLGGRVFGDPTVVFRRDAAEKVGFYDPDFNNENPLWYRLLRHSKGAVLGEPLYLTRWLLTSLSRSSNQEFVNSGGSGSTFSETRRKYDPANAAKLKKHNEFRECRAVTGKLQRGLLVYLSAGDRPAAIQLTWRGYKADPLSLARLKLLMYALMGVTGIRTESMRKAKTHLSRCSSPLQVAASESSQNVGSLTLEACEK